MNYIILDLEWNQPLSPQRMIREPFNLGGEIIQIGAVKIDSLEELNIMDRYSKIVKPVFYTKMNKHVNEVTELTDDDLSRGRPFTEVCPEFLKWCGDDYAFITWGDADIYMLEDNMSIHDMDIKAHSFYDGMMTGSTRLGRFVVNGVWRMDREEMLEYQAGAFEPIPADFTGKILEVPVGTGVLSMPVWKTLPDADITCLDYSEKMMASAEKRAAEMDIGNITFRQGDVGDLPFEDASFDAVVSLNGFHAFPDKEAAFSETCRVLKPGGIFCGCFYVEGSNAHTDKRIRQFYIKSGFFTPPFETAGSLRERLEKMYDDVEVYTVESIAVFRGRKKM